MSEGFAEVDLPSVGKRVERSGVAGNLGLRTAVIRPAAERGVGFWLWTPRLESKYGRQIKARRRIPRV
jgi:hypothetical protein